jgi:hypothetical protein
MQRQWADIQVQKIANLEICVAQCTEAVHSFQKPSKILSPTAIEQHPSEIVCTPGIANSKGDCKQLARKYKKVASSLRRQNQILVRLELPSWLRLTSLCLEICSQRSLYGMSLNVKVYRTVDFDAPIMKCAREGNVSAIREMFSNGTATPIDTWAGLETVLNVGDSTFSIQFQHTY